MIVDLFSSLGEISPEDLVAAVPPGQHPAQIRNEEGTSLVLMCTFLRRTDLVDALRAGWPDMPLHEAAATGDAGRTRRLIEDGTDALDLLSPDGWTALHFAAQVQIFGA